jgi:transketolase
MNQKEARELRLFAAQIRLETVKCIGSRGSGHIGGSLSVADVLAVLYGGAMHIDPKNPAWPGRDKLVMSKGHAGPAVYAALALKGFFPLEWLSTLNRPGTRLPSHCDRKLTPGVDMTCGSLGQGLSAAIGLAIAQRLDGYESRTYIITGDGECDEGQVWEGALFAPQHNLANLTWFVDYNGKQLDGRTKDVIDMRDFTAKANSFGWNAIAIDGNDVEAIAGAIDCAKSEKLKPTCIVLKTVKGAGVPAVADTEMNHSMELAGSFLETCVQQAQETITRIEKEAA